MWVCSVCFGGRGKGVTALVKVTSVSLCFFSSEGLSLYITADKGLGVEGLTAWVIESFQV